MVNHGLEISAFVSTHDKHTIPLVVTFRSLDTQYRIENIWIEQPSRYRINEDEDTHFFATIGNRFLMGKDCNFKHHKWGFQGNRNQKSLKTPYLIDFCITKGIPANRLIIEENYDLSSDHFPIL